MNKNIGWRFNPGDRLGINDSGTETFRGKMITSLGREICQNSIDAMKEGEEKVKIEFKEFEIDREKIPGIKQLTSSFSKALEFWSQDNNHVDQAIKFFKNGLKVLNQDKISVLRVSDFNTTGLLKSKEHYSSPWVNLITATGVSQKSGNAGGSFGIGKSAPFTCTDLRTVFYSTLDEEGVEASQGVSRIATFKDEDGKETSGKGYYGVSDESFPNGNAPIYNQTTLDPSFKRTTSGTDIYILGFKEFENWKEELLVALLQDFIISIDEEKLQIKIGDINLEKENLADVINSLYQKYKKELNKTYNYHQVLISKKSRTLEHMIEDLGKIKFKFLLGADVPKEKIEFHRQALIVRRTGMKLFDRGYISSSIPFVGILRLVDEDVNSFFRELEPPRHDAWEADLYQGKETKAYVKAKIQEVYRFMKDTINDLGSLPVEDEMDAAGLGDYLPDEFLNQMGKEADKESISNKSKKIEIVDIKKPGKSKTKTPDKLEDVEVQGIFDVDGLLVGGKAKNTDKERTGSGGNQGSYDETDDQATPVRKLTNIRTIKERIMLIDKDKNIYKIILELESKIKLGYIELFISHEEGKEKAFVSNIENLENIAFIRDENKIYFSSSTEVNKFETIFELEYKEQCSLKVRTYGSKS